MAGKSMPPQERLFYISAHTLEFIFLLNRIRISLKREFTLLQFTFSNLLFLQTIHQKIQNLCILLYRGWSSTAAGIARIGLLWSESDDGTAGGVASIWKRGSLRRWGNQGRAVEKFVEGAQRFTGEMAAGR
jgi:hypothetical protein